MQISSSAFAIRKCPLYIAQRDGSTWRKPATPLAGSFAEFSTRPSYADYDDNIRPCITGSRGSMISFCCVPDLRKAINFLPVFPGWGLIQHTSACTLPGRGANRKRAAAPHVWNSQTNSQEQVVWEAARYVAWPAAADGCGSASTFLTFGKAISSFVDL